MGKCFGATWWQVRWPDEVFLWIHIHHGKVRQALKGAIVAHVSVLCHTRIAPELKLAAVLGPGRCRMGKCFGTTGPKVPF